MFLLFWSYEALELWSPSGALEDFESALKRLAVVENPYIRFFVTFWCFYFFGAKELWSCGAPLELRRISKVL